MFTTCPQCSLNLAVTVSDLRLGQGYVRCGRCTNVFNALLTLSDEGDGDAAPAATPAPVPDAAEMPSQEDQAGPVEVVDPEPPVDPNETTGEVEVLRTGTFETIILEGDGILQTEETVAESEVDAQLQALVQRFDAVREAEEQEAASNSLWPADEDTPSPDYDLDEDEPQASTEFEFDEDEEPALQPQLDAAEPGPTASSDQAEEPVRADERADEQAFEPSLEDSVEDSRRRARWVLGSALLALLLIGQAVHQFREELVSLPWATNAMTALYGQFHVTLEPRWDLQAYEVRQLGADATPGETPHITVRASIRNRSVHAQPPPLLRVVLQDRYGNQIATREVAPLEYLRGSAPPRLSADQRVDADLLLPDPGQTAVGFEIDACLRSARGELRCASDPAH